MTSTWLCKRLIENDFDCHSFHHHSSFRMVISIWAKIGKQREKMKMLKIWNHAREHESTNMFGGTGTCESGNICTQLMMYEVQKSKSSVIVSRIKCYPNNVIDVTVICLVLVTIFVIFRRIWRNVGQTKKTYKHKSVMQTQRNCIIPLFAAIVSVLEIYCFLLLLCLTGRRVSIHS